MDIKELLESAREELEKKCGVVSIGDKVDMSKDYSKVKIGEDEILIQIERLGGEVETR